MSCILGICERCRKPLTAQPQRPRAWLVVEVGGAEAVFVDRTKAEQVAVERHGIVVPLVTEQIA